MDVLRPDPSVSVEHAISKIREQLEVNLKYFEDPEQQWLLGVLQGHVETQLKEIELYSGLPVKPYGE